MFLFSSYLYRFIVVNVFSTHRPSSSHPPPPLSHARTLTKIQRQTQRQIDAVTHTQRPRHTRHHALRGADGADDYRHAAPRTAGQARYGAVVWALRFTPK